MNSERLTLTDCTITGNSGGTSGGGITNDQDLTIVGGTISGNSGRYGGGISSGGCLTIVGTTISSNLSLREGGGIYIDEDGQLTVTGSSISGNVAPREGGGIFSYKYGVLTVTGSTISGNVSGGYGGGIFSNRGYESILSTTIVGNLADVRGGGIFKLSGTMTIAHSTIASNVSDANASGGETGGGIDNEGADLLVTHTIVARNFRSGFSTRDDVSGEITASFSLIGDGTGATITDSGGNQIGNSVTPINPLLGNLTGNGGPTATVALLAGSPAIDAGDPAAVAGAGGVPLFDQRGVPFGRVTNGDGIGGARIDIGAFELQPIGPCCPAITTTTTGSTRPTTRCGGTR